MTVSRNSLTSERSKSIKIRLRNTTITNGQRKWTKCKQDISRPIKVNIRQHKCHSKHFEFRNWKRECAEMQFRKLHGLFEQDNKLLHCFNIFIWYCWSINEQSLCFLTLFNSPATIGISNSHITIVGTLLNHHMDLVELIITIWPVKMLCLQ